MVRQSIIACKYVIEVPANTSHAELDKVRDELDRWWVSSRPIMFLWGVKIIRIGGEMDCSKCGDTNMVGNESCKFCGERLMWT